MNKRLDFKDEKIGDDIILEKVFNLVSLVIVVLDKKGRVVRISDSVYNWTGHKPEELYGLDLFHNPTMTAKSKVLIMANFAKRILGKDIPPYEVQFKHKDGRIIRSIIDASPLLDSENKPIAVVAVVSEISEAEQVKDQLEESEGRYQALIDATPDATTTTNLEGNITYASKQTAKLHGYSDPKELLGTPGVDLIHPEDRDRAIKNIQVVLNQGMIRDVSYRMVKKDGSEFIGELSAVLLKDSDGAPSGFIASVSDITDRKKAEHELENKMVELKKVNDLMVGRERKMVELKSKIQKLEKKPQHK